MSAKRRAVLQRTASALKDGAPDMPEPHITGFTADADVTAVSGLMLVDAVFENGQMVSLRFGDEAVGYHAVMIAGSSGPRSIVLSKPLRSVSDAVVPLRREPHGGDDAGALRAG